MKIFAATSAILVTLCAPALADPAPPQRPAGEYRSTSSLPFAHGATAELGTANGPRLTVEVQ